MWTRKNIILGLICMVLTVWVGAELLRSQTAGKTGDIVAKSLPEKTQEQRHLKLERRMLIEQLVKRGDAATVEDPFFFFLFASNYAPEDRAIALKVMTAYESSPSREANCPGGGLAYLETINSRWLPSIAAAFSEWPMVTREMELLELHMLLDRRLVGDLSVFRMQRDPGGWFLVFCAVPAIGLDDLVQQYGNPTMEEGQADGWVTLGYGRVRIVADDTRRLRAVVYPIISLPSN